MTREHVSWAFDWKKERITYYQYEGHLEKPILDAAITA